MDVTRAHQQAQFDRLIKSAEKVNREIEVVARAAEIAENVGSFRSQYLLNRARDKLTDAWLLIKEAQRVAAPGAEEE